MQCAIQPVSTTKSEGIINIKLQFAWIHFKKIKMYNLVAL